MLADADVDDHYNPSVRIVDLEKPASGSCGFHLTRSKWDPYPWVTGVDPGSAAHAVGLQSGDCVVEVNGEDIIGKRVSEVAQLVKARPNHVSLMVWNAGVNSQCLPETMCCGPMTKNLQRLSACMASILTFLECPICMETTFAPTYQCDNGHLFCMRCRMKTERCPICRISFTRGRSLLADQIYNAITEAFELRDDSRELRSAKLQNIFKLKKNKNIPSIKVTQTHTNKILARLIGKSSSVDNLASKRDEGHLVVGGGFSADLKVKSLSSTEIFQSASPCMSRAASVNGLNRAAKSHIPFSSHHVSTESLDQKTMDSLTNQVNFIDGILHHCPYSIKCSSLVKGEDIMQHFQRSHDGPLIQYFKPKIRLSAYSIRESNTYVFSIDDKMFFLKTINDADPRINAMDSFGNTRIWVWLLGTKHQSLDYQVSINIFNENNETNVLLSVKSGVYSLNSVSWADIMETKKGIYFSSKSLDAICSRNTIFAIEICSSNETF